MTSPNFDNLFTAAALEMLAAFERSSSGNRPDEIGAPREIQVKNFLKDWLPEKYGISKGYILNAEKKVSRECDIVIYSSETCPKFYFDKQSDIRFFPKNEVYSTFEIKSTLNESELNDALDKINSVKEISSHKIEWLYGDKEWDEHDVKLAELDEDEDFFGRPKKKYLRNEDYNAYKLKIKKKQEKYSTTFCGIFAYKGGKKLDLNSIRDILITKENPPDILVIRDKGLLIKVDDFTLKRLRAINENKAQYHINDFDILWQKIQLLGFGNKIDYLILENSDDKVNLMYFYIFLIDFLNEFNKCPDSYAADIISVWKKD